MINFSALAKDSSTNNLEPTFRTKVFFIDFCLNFERKAQFTG